MDESLTLAETLFHQLCALEPAQRNARLDEIGSTQPSLAAALSALLRAAGEPDTRLDRPARDLLLDTSGAAANRANHAEAVPLAELDGSVPPSRRYQSLGEVGRGGMGRVELVFDRVLERTIARKVLRAGLPVSPASAVLDSESAQRFLREARVLAELDHPGIPPIHDFGVDAEGWPFFTMKLIQVAGAPQDSATPADAAERLGERRTLEDVLAAPADDATGTGQRRAIEILVRVCDAVAYAHARGVIHRDLKPANVMVGGFGEVYVLDWGIAHLSGGEPKAAHDESRAGTKRTDSQPGPASTKLTLAGDLLGTPGYMAPEQALGGAVDARADVFALGAILYRILAGIAPYHDVLDAGAEDRVAAFLAATKAGPCTSARQLAPSAPAELLAVCEKAMALEPDQRYETVQALREDLQAYLDLRESPTWELSWAARMVKSVRRRPARATGAIAGLVVLTIVVVSTAILLSAHEEQLLAVEGRRIAEQTLRVVQARDQLQSFAEREVLGTFAVFSRATEQLERRRTTQHDPAGKLLRERRYGATASDLLQWLAALGVDLSNPANNELSIAAVRVGTDRTERLVQSGLYMFAEQLLGCGVAVAAYVIQHPEVQVENRAEWAALASRNPVLLRAAQNLEPLLELLGGQERGIATYRAMIRWGLNNRDELGGALDSLDSYSMPELEFLTYALTEVRPSLEVLPLLDVAVARDPSSFWLRARELVIRTQARWSQLDAEQVRGVLEVALRHGEAALALWPESTVVPLNMAMAFDRLDQLDDAERVLRALLMRAPDYADAWINLGGVLAKGKRWEEALSALSKGTEVEPNDVANWMAKGLVADSCLTSVEESNPLFERAVDTSMEAWRKVHELDPREWQAYLYLGAAYMAVSRFDEAIAEYDAGMPLHPKDRDLRNFKAEALFGATRVREALELELEVLKDWPKDPSARDNFELWLPSITDPAERAALAARLPPR